MKTTKRTLAVAAALAALAVVSCKGRVDGGSPPTAGDNSGISADPGPAAAAPAQVPVPMKPAEVVPVPAGASPETAPVPKVETVATLPSPAVLDAVSVAQGRLAGVTAGVQGASVRYVDCSDAARCSTRLEATSLAGLRDLLQAVSKDQGGIGFVAREQLDAYTGQKFVADVTLGGTTTRPIPTDANELLVNND